MNAGANFRFESELANAAIADDRSRYVVPLLYVGWDEHMTFSAPLCVPLSLSLMLFSDFASQLLPKLYGAHPDFARIDWARVQWFAGSRLFTPQMHRTLAENGLAHQSLIRFRTPGLEGVLGSCG